jgi:hypothetical protein
VCVYPLYFGTVLKYFDISHHRGTMVEIDGSNVARRGKHSDISFQCSDAAQIQMIQILRYLFLNIYIYMYVFVYILF